MNIKNLLFFSTLSLLPILLNAQEVYKNEDLSISKLKDWMWVVETTDMTTMYILEGSKRAILIDTGTKCENLDKVVSQITQKPLDVVITHLHPDHAGNIKYFDEIYLHPADTLLIADYRDYKGKIHYIHEGDVFNLGNIELKVYLMPGHTPGSIVLVDHKNGDCYSGDTLGSGQVWLQLKPHVPMNVYHETCIRMEQLMEQGVKDIWCGHYPYLKMSLKQPYITQMRMLSKRISDGDISDAKPYPIQNSNKYLCKNPVIMQNGMAMIVFDADNIN